MHALSGVCSDSGGAWWCGVVARRGVGDKRRGDVVVRRGDVVVQGVVLVMVRLGDVVVRRGDVVVAKRGVGDGEAG